MHSMHIKCTWKQWKKREEKIESNRQASVELVVLSIEKNVSLGEFLQLTSELKVESGTTYNTTLERKMKISKISQQWTNCIMQFICYLIFWYPIQMRIANIKKKLQRRVVKSRFELFASRIIQIGNRHAACLLV
jgi:hypothetical protein